MDILLGKVTQQAMNYAIRSGVTITASYAIKQCGRLLKEAPRSKDREELKRLQLRLDSKITIISPAIDMIDLISARGNTSLNSAVSLTKEIRMEIQRLGTRMDEAANDEAMLNRKSSRAKTREETERELRAIVLAIKELLQRIEDAVPLINLAITTSGVNLSTKLSGTISPSRLLQASAFLTAADAKYTTDPETRHQVGATYNCSLYMLFGGHVRETDKEGVRGTTWKEVIHKARVKLMRVPLDQLYDLPGEKTSNNGQPHDTLPGEAGSVEFAYQLVIIEDLDDDRVHTFEENEPRPGRFDEVTNAGIRDIVPVHEISKIFYADTGKILNIGGDSEVNNPVLLLKRDVHAEPPRRMMRQSQMDGYIGTPSIRNGNGDESGIDAQFERESVPGTPVKDGGAAYHGSSTWRLPADLDPEWLALEVYAEEADSDLDEDEDEDSSLVDRPVASRQSSTGPSLAGALSKLQLRSPSPQSEAGQLIATEQATLQPSPLARTLPPMKTNLSLLEMLLKLTALQQFRQESHLSIEDELLNFFLEDSATAGAGADKDRRQRLRHDAVRRVGFDPYDESPIKRRGEQYIQYGGAASPQPLQYDTAPFPYDDAYGYDEGHELQYAHPSIEQNGLASSPSPQRPLLLSQQQTPSRSSTPGSISSEQHRRQVQAKYDGTAATYTPPSATRAGAAGVRSPPGVMRARQAILRAQNEPKPKSPLGREFGIEGRRGDEGLGTSPSSEALGTGRQG